MGIVLSISEPALDNVLYGNKSSILNNYIQQQMQQLQPAFNDFSGRIYQSLQNSYNFINNKLVQYGIMNELQNSGIQVTDNYYQSLMSFEELQNANYTMQRWVMCHPELRQLYVDQNIDGYSGSYQNVFGKGVGENDYNYRRVMDGVVQDREDYFVYKHYLEDILENDRELDHYEKVRVLHTHDCITHLLETSNFDFTCKTSEPSKINRS
jgi:hypothetical protein